MGAHVLGLHTRPQCRPCLARAEEEGGGGAAAEASGAMCTQPFYVELHMSGQCTTLTSESDIKGVQYRERGRVMSKVFIS